jgi:hypothetical protein
VSDPLIGTLVVVPLVLAGLGAIEVWLQRRGTSVASTASNAFQAGALVILFLVGLGRWHLGLEANSPGLDSVLAGGMLMLLVVRVLFLVSALSRVERGGAIRRPSWPFFVLPLVVYIAILPWSAGQRQPDGDEPYFLLITHSLIHDLDTDLTNNYAAQHSLKFSSRVLEPEWADPKRADGSIYSRHSLVLPLLLAPGYLLAGRMGAMVTMGILAAAVAWLGLFLMRRYFPSESESAVVGAWSLLALTPPVLLYAHQIWVELPAAALLLFGVHQIQALEHKAGSGRRQWIGLGLALVLLPLLKLRFVLLAVPLLFLAWWRTGRSRRTVLWAALALGAALGGILIFNSVVFGNPFKDHTLTQLLQIQGRSPLDYLRGSIGLFWDCAFGLFASNPLWMLLIPASVLVLWQRTRLLTDLMILVIPYLMVISPRREWYGAWAPPFRFGMVLLPLLALLLVPLLRRRDQAGAQGLLAVLGWAALALMVLFVVIPGWTYNLAVGTNHLVDHLSIRWATDVGRLLPSMVRLRTASWLVPLLGASLVLALWWRPRRRPHRATGWATSLLLLALAALPVAATRLTTGIVEFEDRQVIKNGGELYPGPWEPYRPRFRGGWKIAAGQSLQAPIVAGGEQFHIELDFQPRGRVPSQAEIEAYAGSELLGSRSIENMHGWQTIEFEGDRWPAGAELVIRFTTGESAEDQSAIVLDRARISWR